MSVLADTDLTWLYPEYQGEVGPASIDLHIGTTLQRWPLHERRDPRIDQATVWMPVALREDRGGPFWVLRPGFRYLAATAERVRIPEDCAGQISARSSWGRDGLAVICGPAGWCDPGYHGNPTLELSVIGSELLLWPGAAVCQLVLHQLASPCRRPYGHPDRASKYQGNEMPTPSRLWHEVTP